MKKDYKKNIAILTVHLMFSKRFVAPIMMLYFQSFGLNYAQIGALSALTQFTDAALEVLGGAFSDVYGRKLASMIYAILGLIAMAIYSWGSSYWQFALAAIIYGLAIAIGSGNAGALLYDTLDHLNLTNQYKKYRGRMSFPSKMLNSIILIAIPYLFSKNIRLPFLLGMLFYVVSLITAFLFVTESNHQPHFKNRTIFKNIKNSFVEIFNNVRLIKIIGCEVVLNSFSVLALEYFQPLIKQTPIPLVYIGIIFAAAKAVEGFASLLAYKLTKKPSSHLLIIVGAAMMLSFFGFAVFHNYFVVLFILLSSATAGAKDIAIADLLNQNITAANRTTILSTVNVFDSLFSSLLFFLFGYAVNGLGLKQSFAIALSVLTLLLTLLFALIKKAKSTRVEP